MATRYWSMTGVNIVNVLYKGSGAAQIGLLGGEVHMTFPPVGSVVAHVKSGRMRLLAVATAQPSSRMREYGSGKIRIDTKNTFLVIPAKAGIYMVMQVALCYGFPPLRERVRP